MCVIHKSVLWHYSLLSIQACKNVYIMQKGSGFCWIYDKYSRLLHWLCYWVFPENIRNIYFRVFVDKFCHSAPLSGRVDAWHDKLALIHHYSLLMNKRKDLCGRTNVVYKELEKDQQDLKVKTCLLGQMWYTRGLRMQCFVRSHSGSLFFILAQAEKLELLNFQI